MTREKTISVSYILKKVICLNKEGIEREILPERRLARNLLRNVEGCYYVGKEPESTYVMNEIQKVASLMRFELMRGNVDAFAELLEYHWSLSKKVDAGSMNTLIGQIFFVIENMIDGHLVCGAGGFLQVILKKGSQRKWYINS